MFFKTIDFSRYSSIKVGQPTQVMMIEKEDTIPKDRYIIGGANNLLLSPTPPPLMMLSKDFAYIKEENNLLEVGASMPSGRLVSYAKKHNLSGFEFIAKLPGHLGGLVAMNAGVKEYEIFNIIHSIQINNQWIQQDKVEYGYRYAKLNGIVTAVKFDIKHGYNYKLEAFLNKLRANQPSTPSAGSAFKNPPNDSAGRLIDAVGLKGFQKGDMAWSNIHANFLVNLGDGNFEDAIYLLQLAKKRVQAEFGITLLEEIKIL